MRNSEENSVEDILFELNPLPMWIYDENHQKTLATNLAFGLKYSFLEYLSFGLSKNYKTTFCEYLNSNISSMDWFCGRSSKSR
jgi:hypothetical protein